MGRLAGRVALVTGAANGIGKAIAARFAGEGARVFLADIDATVCETVAAELTAAGLQADAIAADVTRGQDVTRLFRTIETEAGRIDVLLNNAGINVRTDFRHLSDADWVRLREVNLDGAIRVARDGLPLLSASGSGSLINLSSIMAHRGFRQLAAYSATKGALSALTRALALEYAPFNVRVNALAPGFIETQITERVLRVPPIAKALLERTPMRRFGTPDDVAKAAMFFATDDSSYVTGAELAVDGGMAAAL